MNKIFTAIAFTFVLVTGPAVADGPTHEAQAQHQSGELPRIVTR